MKTRRSISVLLHLLPALLAMPPFAHADEVANVNLQQWQARRLNYPTPREIVKEREGNVYIYDGLTDRQVEQAMDKNFNRIEYMMFLGTLKTDPTGSVRRDEQGNAETESAGCMN
jgi:hypothetical protein